MYLRTLVSSAGMLLERLYEGDIVRIPRALQELEMYSFVKSCAFTAIRSVSSDTISETIESEGLSTIHRHLSEEKLLQLVQKLRPIYFKMLEGMVERFVRHVFHLETGFSVCRNIYVRFSRPNFSMLEGNPISKKERALGLAEPHRDPWLGYGSNAITMWFAMTPVRQNGILFFPENWGQKNEEQRAVVPLGKSITLDCDPGDCLLFHGAHLHQSLENRTQDTRFNITTRFCISEPKDYLPGFEWVSY